MRQGDLHHDCSNREHQILKTEGKPDIPLGPLCFSTFVNEIGWISDPSVKALKKRLLRL